MIENYATDGWVLASDPHGTGVMRGTITGESTPSEIFTDLKGFVDHDLTGRRIMFLPDTKTSELRGMDYPIYDSECGFLTLSFPLSVAPQKGDSFIIYDSY